MIENLATAEDAAPITAHTQARWTVVASSVRGTSHVRRDMPCQDSFAVEHLPDGTIIAAVADGAGSAAHAEEGAEAATTVAVESLAEQLRLEGSPDAAEDWRALMTNAFTDAHETLLDMVNIDAEPRDFASTLILLVLSHGWTVCGSIGDCAAVLRGKDGFVSPCMPQKGEYANQTNFLSQENAIDLLDIAVLPTDISHAALFSDGLLELAMNVAHNRPFTPFFAPLFAFMNSVAPDAEAEASAQLADFLDSERVTARTDDDKTLILLRRQ